MTVPPPHETKHPGQAPLTAEEFQKQLDSARRQVYDSLQDHFEKTRQSEADSSRGIVPWFRRNRTDLYFLITLLIIGSIWLKPFSKREPRGGSPPDTTQVTTAETPNSDSSKLSEVFNDAVRFGDYLTNNPARSGAWVDSAKAASQLNPAQISEEVRDTLARIWAKRPGDRTDANLDYLRDALFSYVYGLWEKQNGGNADGFRIDPAFDQYNPELLEGMAKRLDLGDVVGDLRTVVRDSTGARKKGFRAAVVVRWMQTYSTSDSIF